MAPGPPRRGKAAAGYLKQRKAVAKKTTKVAKNAIASKKVHDLAVKAQKKRNATASSGSRRDAGRIARSKNKATTKKKILATRRRQYG